MCQADGLQYQPSLHFDPASVRGAILPLFVRTLAWIHVLAPGRMSGHECCSFYVVLRKLCSVSQRRLALHCRTSAQKRPDASVTAGPRFSVGTASLDRSIQHLPTIRRLGVRAPGLDDSSGHLMQRACCSSHGLHMVPNATPRVRSYRQSCPDERLTAVAKGQPVPAHDFH